MDANIRPDPMTMRVCAAAATAWQRIRCRGPTRTLLASCVVLASCLLATPQAGAAGIDERLANQAASPSAGSETRGYVISPGDQLRVLVQRMPELNVDVLVRPDGRISTPLVADLLASGKTPTEVAGALETALSVSVQAPVVSVIVLQATSRATQVRVLGQAVSPKAVPFRDGMTVLDLATETGGLSPFAAGNRARIVRVDSSGTHEIRVRLDDLLNRGRLSENRPLVAGDILVIPASWF
jgi:polysaccharide export outer membrane protein